MKKILILLTFILLLSGCSQSDTSINPILENIPDTSKLSNEGNYIYEDENSNISFEYPTYFKISFNPTKYEQSVILMSENNRDIYFNYKADSYSQYEENNREAIQQQKINIYTTTIGNYVAKRYEMHGGINYLFEINGNFVQFYSEQYLSPEQEKGIEIILNSIKFPEEFSVEGNNVTVNSENLTFTFKDNFEINGKVIEFGPETTIPESPTDKVYTRPNFELKLVEKHSFNEIAKYSPENPNITIQPVNIKINNLDIAKWTEGIMCDSAKFEIIGQNQNIQISDRNCSSKVNPEDYILELLKSVE